MGGGNTGGAHKGTGGQLAGRLGACPYRLGCVWGGDLLVGSAGKKEQGIRGEELPAIKGANSNKRAGGQLEGKVAGSRGAGTYCSTATATAVGVQYPATWSMHAVAMRRATSQAGQQEVRF